MVEPKFELLYFDDCPSWQDGLENLKAALIEEGINDADIQLVLIDNEVDALKEKFLGSPSFRVNGQDLWPEERKTYHLGCRVYASEKGHKGFPSIEMVREKIREIITI
jgi:hypothetical protein